MEEIERYEKEINQHRERIQQLQRAIVNENNQVIAKLGIIEYIKSKEENKETNKEVKNERDSGTNKRNKGTNTKSNNKTVSKK